MYFRNLDGTTKESFSVGTPSDIKRKIGYFGWAQSNIEISTTSTTYVTYLTFTTPVLPIGWYCYEWSYVHLCTKVSKQQHIRVTIDGTEYHQITHVPVDTAQRMAGCGTWFLEYTTVTAHTVLLQHSVTGTQVSSTIYQAVLSCRRVK